MSINIGILGFAHGHVGMYANWWKDQPRDRVTLVAGWDHDAARAKSNCEKFGMAVEPSVDALLKRPDISAIVIGAETSMHADLVEQAAAAGKAIVLQKPIALTTAEADRIVAAIEKSNVPFTLAWQMRVDPQNLRMKQLLKDGTLGRLLMIRRRHGLATQLWKDFEKSWHADPKLNKGMWADDASHAIDWLYWLLGEPESVTAEIATLLNPRVPDDHGIATFRYTGGVIAEIACSFTAVAGENTTEITGERGVAIQNFGDLVSCNAPRTPGAVGLKWFIAGDKQWTDSHIPSPTNHAERIVGLAPELLKFLAGERPAICTAREGRASLAMTLACYRSSELGRRVQMSEMQSGKNKD